MGTTARTTFAALAVLVLATSAGCIRTAEDVQRDYAQRLRPVQLGGQTTPVPTHPPVQTRRVRVYADEDYQVQAGDWQARVLAQVQRANQALLTDLAVVLEVESLRAWPREDRGRSLETALAQLEALDPGTDVDWVVGLVSSSRVFSASHHDLGVARLFGRHFVLRGMDSPAEAQQLSRVLDKLPVDERLALFRARRLHKETAVFLHEWAHTLGAFHDRTVDWLMSRTYDEHQALFSEATVGLLRVGLAHRDRASDPEGRKLWAEAYRGHVHAHASPDWHPQSKEEALKDVAQMLEGQGGGQGARLSEAERLRFNEAVRTFNAGQFDEADAQLSPLVTAHPAHADLQELGCLVAHRRAPKAQQTLTRCATAASLPSARPQAHLVLAHARLDAADTQGALAELSRAQAKLAAGGADAHGWVYLASLGRQALAPHIVEAAVQRVPMHEEAPNLSDWAVRLRRWAAVPRGAAGMTPEQEPHVIAAVLAAEEALRANKKGPARAQRDLLRADYKDAAATRLVDCMLALHEGRRDAARSACQAAVAKDPEAVMAVHALGQLLLMDRNPALAKRRFARVLELAPHMESGWVNLAQALRTLGETAALADLERRFQARFGRRLP